MLITKQIEIDMGHRVPNHKSKCRNLHGHRYKIEVGVDDKIIDVKFDHGFVMYDKDEIEPLFRVLKKSQEMKIVFVPFIPTAENLAKYWYELIKPRLKRKKIKIKFVRVFETPTSTATYEK